MGELALDLSDSEAVHVERIVTSVAFEIFKHVAATNDLLARSHSIKITNVDSSVDFGALQRGDPVCLVLP